MALPVLDGTPVVYNGTSGTPTLAVTISATANRYLFVGIVLPYNSASGITSVVANGSENLSLVKDSGVSGDGNSRSLLYGLVAPSSGSYNVVITPSGVSNADRISATAVAYNTVDQSTPLGTPVSAFVVSGNPTIDVTAGADGLVVDCACIFDGGSSPVVGSGQTSRSNHTDNAARAYICMSEEAGPGTITMNWTGGSGYDSATCAVELKGVSAPPAATLEQEGYRWVNDDGSESASTFAASQDTGITAAAGSTRRLRVLLNATGDPDTYQYKLQWRKSGGTWADLT